MKSIRSVFKIGVGPSSSHTMGPTYAARTFFKKYPSVEEICVILYGSLSKTGKGHGTDRAVKQALSPIKTEVIFDSNEYIKLEHPNTMEFIGYNGGVEKCRMTVLSIGGGEIIIDGEKHSVNANIYRENNFSEIASYCKSHNMRLCDYVMEHENDDILEYLLEVWTAMENAIHEGLTKTGILPGGLGVQRKAQLLFQQRHIDESPQTRENRLVCAYAFAVSEQNADCGVIVTAPTCGACGVLPAVLKYMKEKNQFSDIDICRALAVAGLVGRIVEENASISGAECGCQAEIGTACAMTSAALGELFEMGIDQIEYAAEIALEHHLGLTCDPVCGLVQIPCIERNAVAAMRAINAVSLASFLSDTRKISLDDVIKTMKETGINIASQYRETSEGGLAKLNIK